MYCTDEGEDAEAAFLHTWRPHDGEMSNHSHMKILHQMGFLKTAIVRSDSPCATIRRVVFAHLQPEMEGMGHEPRQPTPWPTRQLSNALFDIPFCPTTWPSCSGQHRINFGLPLNDIATLFHPERFPLCTTLDGLVLPTSTQSAVSAICCSSDVSFDSLDCLVIFTDGSSMSAQRHRPPLQADESGQGDTWAFLVLGERYGDPHSELFLIGWQAQPGYGALRRIIAYRHAFVRTRT